MGGRSGESLPRFSIQVRMGMHAEWNCRNLLLWVGLEFWIASLGGFNAAKPGGLGEEECLELRFLCGFWLFFGMFRWWISQIWCLVRHSKQCRDAIVLKGWTDLGRRVSLGFFRLIWGGRRRWCCGFSATALSCGRQVSSIMSVWWASSKAINVCSTKVKHQQQQQQQ